MLTFDLHYHANVYGLGQTRRRNRLERHRAVMERNRLDFVASTEHSYKDALDAYLHLADVASNYHTRVIPGVEAVAKEGVDIAFLFRTEEDLRNGLKQLQPFEWSMWDMKTVAEATGAVSILVHPFTPGKSGVVTVAGVEGFRRLIHDADYVEAHNGSGLFMMRAANQRTGWAMGKTFRQKAAFTAELPERFIPKTVGTTMSSDAHFPEHQLIVGKIDGDVTRQNDWFELLRQRVRFTQYAAPLFFSTDLENASDRKTFSSLSCVLGEAVQKRRIIAKRIFDDMISGVDRSAA